jgi:homoserine dehydrogenase
LSFPYYLRITAKDKAGVMAKISKALSKRKISIESIIQKPSKRSNFAEIILITHTVKESSLLSSIKQIKRLSEVSSSVKFIRIEDSL